MSPVTSPAVTSSDAAGRESPRENFADDDMAPSLLRPIHAVKDPSDGFHAVSA
jgi:hypothetical protein